MRTTLFIYSIITSLFSYCQSPVYTTASFIELDSSLAKILTAQKVAGFAVAIVKGDSILYSKGFGYRDAEAKLPVTANTLFPIGSSTKAFTCAAIGQLEKEGKLKMDDIATNVLPRLKFYNNELNNSVTLRDMMSHRTGIERYDYSWYLFNSSNRDSLLRRIQYFEPSKPLRQSWLYNNFMYLALGKVIEEKTGKSWEQNIKERFFTPLGMSRSNFSIADMEKDADASQGYGVDDKGAIKKINYYNINGMGPAGSINSSVNDMAQWLKLWINGGRYQSKEILPHAYVEAAASSQAVMHAALPGAYKDIHFANYGLGWMLTSYRGYYRVEHGGNIDGFTANVCFYPSEGMGIVVLVNQNASAATATARNIISDKILDLPFIDWNKKFENKADSSQSQSSGQKSTRVPGTRPSHPLKDYAGTYFNPAYGTVNIGWINDTLKAKLGNKNVWLQHYHYDVFALFENGARLKDSTATPNMLLSFSTDHAGKIANIIIPTHAPERDEVFKRQHVAQAINTAELTKYAGTYELSGIVVTVSIKSGTLYVYVPGQPEYETDYLGDHTFKLKALQGYSVKFIVQNDNTCTEAQFIQPNGIFSAKRKNN